MQISLQMLITLSIIVYNMGPHQSGSITSPSGVDAYSQDHTFDAFSGNDMGGLKGAFTSNETSPQWTGLLSDILSEFQLLSETDYV